MRHFIVLGFKSNSKKEKGTQVYLGSDYDEANKCVGTECEEYSRRELYELATPLKRRHKYVEPVTAEDTSPKLTSGAQKLVDGLLLTEENHAKIEPTGSKGTITKADVEAYVKSLDAEEQ